MDLSRHGGTLAGKRILVVGGGQGGDEQMDEPAGNGRAACCLLAREGAHVACADRSGAAAQRTVARIAADGGRAAAIEADVSRTADIHAMIDQAIEALGGLDALVLNVGISHRLPLARLTEESWDAVLGINLKAHMLCVQVALPRMTEGGAIVFVSSVAARWPNGRNPAYEVSKAGLGALCRAAALEGQPSGIRANVVMLGLIDTPMGRAASAARPDRTSAPLPFGRQGTAWEVAAAIRFLVSDESRYVNAIELPVDGGLSAGIQLAPRA